MFVFDDHLMLLSPSRDGYWESNKNCYTQPKPKRGFKMTKISVCVFNLLSSERAFQVRIFPHRIIATFHSRQPYCISKTIFCFVLFFWPATLPFSVWLLSQPCFQGLLFNVKKSLKTHFAVW